MTVAPPFGLIALILLIIIVVTFPLLAGFAGLLISRLGLKFPALKVQRPARSILLAMLVSIPLLLAMGVLDFWRSLTPGSHSFYIPYSVTLYTASFGVFFARLEAPSRGKKELLAIAFLALIPSIIFEIGFEIGSYTLASFF